MIWILRKSIFFVENSTKFGAIKLQGDIISNNIEYIISKFRKWCVFMERRV